MLRMSFSKIYSGQSDIMGASIIDIESDISRGLYSFGIVGLGDKSVDESKDRVSAAIKNTGFESPKSKNHKVVISLAPAHIRKEGPSFDLGIALSYLLSSGEIIFNPEKKLFLGELSLDGMTRPISGVLNIVKEAKAKGFEEVYLPRDNTIEAGLIKGITIYAVESLDQIIRHLDQSDSDREKIKIQPNKETEISKSNSEHVIDFKDIKGQANAKRALEIAAAGGHNVLMWGSPGTGKTMLAKAFVSILPDLTYEEILDATSIHSVAGILKNIVISEPPFRSPHHTASHVAVVGGGNNLKPGEITLAHKGILFLDELPEFDRRVIESLREPLEEKVIKISRAKGTMTFPADFILVAAMNPCPCGNFGSKKKCICNALTINKYNRKISGPIMDRIDLCIEIPEIEHKILNEINLSESSQEVKGRVSEARLFGQERFKKNKANYTKNSDIKSKHIKTLSMLDKDAEDLLVQSAQKLELSPRAYHRTIRLARTIADLEKSENTKVSHVLEALQFRQKREII
jgi:magnesium chelatase family protein